MTARLPVAREEQDGFPIKIIKDSVSRPVTPSRERYPTEAVCDCWDTQTREAGHMSTPRQYTTAGWTPSSTCRAQSWHVLAA